MTEILEQLEINHTFFIQFVLFGAFFFLLSGIYLKPFQKLIEKRNHKLNDDIQSASELLKAVEAKLADYEKLLSEARKEALNRYDAAIADSKTKEAAALQSIKDDLKKEFLVATNNLQEEKLKIESELKLQVNQLSDAIAQKIIAGK
jgi:F0F1-type ATP synthase membrane subunit b/b'